MSTIAEPARNRKPRAKPARFIRVIEQPTHDSDGWGCIEIQVGKQRDTYLVRFLETDFDGVTAFECEKLDANLNAAAVYHVRLSHNPEECGCDCRGHERWGHCKHKEGLAMLVETGRLSAA